MCHYLGGGLHGRQKRVKAQSESSKSVVNSVLISREMPVFPGFLEIIRVVGINIQFVHRIAQRILNRYASLLSRDYAFAGAQQQRAQCQNAAKNGVGCVKQ